MDLYAMLVIIYVVLVILFLLLWIGKKNTNRKPIVKNSIELLVMMNQHFTDSENLQAVVGMINSIDFKNISETEMELFLQIINNKWLTR